MKTRILCPTDFSPCAENALRYASELAKGMDAELTLVNVCPIPVVEVYTPSDVLQKLMKKEEEIANIKLEGLKERMEESYDLEYKTAVLFGYSADEIIKYADQSNQDMIIVGSHGVSRNISRFLGSTSYETVKRANTPCMVIPCEATYRPIASVLIAWDESHEIAVQLGEIYKMSRVSNPSFTIATVTDKGNQDDFCTVLNQEGSIRNVELHAGNVPEAIYQMLEKETFDALALFRHHRGFFENILHKSTIKQVLGNSDIPVLIYNQ